MPDPVRMTVAEFTARYANAHAELIRGVVREYPPCWPKHGKICLNMGAALGNHVEARALGHVMSNDSWVQTGPDSVRGGDICYFSYERLPRGEVPEGLLPVAPDLVVEVRSPSDRWTDLFAKVVEYLKANVRLVILLDPGTETASVYRPDELQQIFHNGDEVTIPDVLPGFAVSVRRLFQ